MASLKTRAERVGNHYIVNGQKTWTTLGQFGEWIFCLVRTSSEGKPQTGISFLLIDMKSPGASVRPIRLLDGECEVNEVWFDNVKVPVENLIGDENKGWTYAKHLLSHERTNIADINRAKRELERLKRIAKIEGGYHGSGGPLMVSTKPPLDKIGSPEDPTPYVPPTAVAGEVHVVPYNNADSLERLFKKHASTIACLIMEPVMENIGILS